MRLAIYSAATHCAGLLDSLTRRCAACLITHAADIAIDRSLRRLFRLLIRILELDAAEPFIRDLLGRQFRDCDVTLDNVVHCGRSIRSTDERRDLAIFREVDGHVWLLVGCGKVRPYCASGLPMSTTSCKYLKIFFIPMPIPG